MKLKYSFENVEMGDEIIAVPVGHGSENLKGVIRINKEGMEIFELLKRDTSEREIINTLAVKYENDEDVLTRYVKELLETLRKMEILSE